MAFTHDDAMDAYLAVAPGAATRLDICTAEPTTRTQAISTYSVGNATPSVGAAADASPNGRKRTVAAVTSGSVTAGGTATHWALTDGTRLLNSGALAAGQLVVNGNTFTLTAFDVRVPDAV